VAEIIVAEIIAPADQGMGALSNDKAACGRGNRANALCAEIDAEPAAAFPLVAGSDANLRYGLPASGSWWMGLPQIQTKKRTPVLLALNSLESMTRRGVIISALRVRLCYPL
jgi:hypothetical protein